MRFEDQRLLMVQELQKAGISDVRVLAAFAKVARENYVLPEYKDWAYRNQPLPILQKQTISQPLMIAIMMQYLKLSPEDRVLEIGTGSGYQSALLAELCSDVCSVERIESLSLGAQQILKEQGYQNIHFRIGDGSKGWIKAYPPYRDFSKIIVSAGADSIPSALTDQLAEGGIMVIPVGQGNYQILKRIIRDNGQLLVSDHGSCAFVPLISDAK
jgi:protein-L-isoaspartate(D-aspartate) O-methyltransferase